MAKYQVIQFKPEDKTVEVDCARYGDAFDPTAPTRTRSVDREWVMDTDNDGRKN